MKHSENIVKIGDAFEVMIGGTPSRKNESLWDSNKDSKNVWLSIRDISKNDAPRILDSAEYISDDGIKYSNVKSIPENTALMTFKLTVGKTTVSGTNLYTNEAIAAFIPKVGVSADPDYLASVLPTLSYETDQAVKGRTLNKAKIADALIPLPGIEIQKRVARILRAISESVGVTQKIINQTELLKKALLENLTTSDENMNELLDLVKTIGDGIHATPRYTNSSDYYFINGNNLSNGRVVIFDSTKMVSEEEFNKYKTDIDENTILMSINGTIGNLAIYNNEKVVLGKSAAYIRCSDLSTRDFVFYYLQTRSVRQFFSNELTGTTIRNLSLASIRKLPTPSHMSQDKKRLVKALQFLDFKIENNKKLKAKQEQLKRGLMQDLLTGKVRV